MTSFFSSSINQYDAISIVVDGMAILPGGFLVVVLLAQGLPIATIPEQSLVTTMWDDMVNNRCPVIHAFRRALHAERMCSEEQFAGFLPCAVIPTFSGRPYCLWVKGKMFIAVLRSIGHESSAAGVMAGCVGSVRQDNSTPSVFWLF